MVLQCVKNGMVTKVVPEHKPDWVSYNQKTPKQNKNHGFLDD